MAVSDFAQFTSERRVRTRVTQTVAHHGTAVSFRPGVHGVRVTCKVFTFRIIQFSAIMSWDMNINGRPASAGPKTSPFLSSFGVEHSVKIIQLCFRAG
jgi:hypothetical protein